MFNYAIIDSKRNRDLPVGLKLKPLVPISLAGQSAEMPLLLSLKELPLANRHLFMESSVMSANGENPWFDVAFKTDFDEDTLIRCLTELLISTLPDGRRFFLRYYDPRVFVQLAWIMPRHRFQLFFGGLLTTGISQWGLLLNGSWFELDSLRFKEQPSLSANNYVKSLHRVGLINLVLNRLMPPPSDLEHRVALGKKINSYLEYAETNYGLSEKDDLVIFASQALTIHPYFDRHPVIQTILNEMSNGGYSYFQRQAMIGKEKWSDVLYEVQSWAKAKELTYD